MLNVIRSAGAFYELQISPQHYLFTAGGNSTKAESHSYRSGVHYPREKIRVLAVLHQRRAQHADILKRPLHY